MSPTAKRLVLIGAVATLAVVAGLAARRMNAPRPTLADAAEVLTPTQAEEGGTEPVNRPTAPVLRNTAQEAGRLQVAFGYKVGATPYAYRLALAFAPEADTGTMELGVPGAIGAAGRFPVERRWSESRHAFLIAVPHDVAGQKAAVPNLCVRAVIGPSKGVLDLADASLCVMQRDADGGCHSSTLACGVIR